jgi:hypothetical protein
MIKKQEERKKLGKYIEGIVLLSRTRINFPLEINMSKFVESKDDHWYDLAGVLIHKGISAYGGRNYFFGSNIRPLCGPYT